MHSRPSGGTKDDQIGLDFFLKQLKELLLDEKKRPRANLIIFEPYRVLRDNFVKHVAPGACSSYEHEGL